VDGSECLAGGEVGLGCGWGCDWRLIDLRPGQHNNGYMDGRSQTKVYTDEQTQVLSTQSSLAITHPSTSRARRYLTLVTKSPNKYWSPPRTDGSGVWEVPEGSAVPYTQ